MGYFICLFGIFIIILYLVLYIGSKLLETRIPVYTKFACIAKEKVQIIGETAEKARHLVVVIVKSALTFKRKQT